MTVPWTVLSLLVDSAPSGEWNIIVQVRDPPFLFIRLLANMLNSLTDLRPVLVVP